MIGRIDDNENMKTNWNSVTNTFWQLCDEPFIWQIFKVRENEYDLYRMNPPTLSLIGTYATLEEAKAETLRVA